MARLDVPAPVRMQRIALAVPTDRLRPALVRLAMTGNVELAGELPAPSGRENDALRELSNGTPAADLQPMIAPESPDLEDLVSRKERDLLAGEVELARRRELAIRQGDVSVLVGWTPSVGLAALRDTLARDGAAVVELPQPAEAPPTPLRPSRVAGPFRLLVDTYGVLPYSDVDPTAFAAAAFVIMFGMMFGDLGHGLLLVFLGLLLSRVRTGRLAAFRPAWPLLVAAGGAGAFFGVLYGEFFGPTGWIPTLWLSPLEQPLDLLTAAIVVGSLLLATSYLLGFVNRWRESGPAPALYAESGLAGTLVFLGVAVAALGWSRGLPGPLYTGVAVALIGFVLVFIGALFRGGRSFTGAVEGFVGMMEAGIRVGSNIVSFTRLAAFGLTHAALSLVTLQGVEQLVARGPGGWIAGGLLFLIGTLIALALEGLVAGIQALRLEYYELFSRVFEVEGRPFRPFAIPVQQTEEMP